MVLVLALPASARSTATSPPASGEAAALAATGVREIWIERFRIATAAKARGTLTLHLPTREIELAGTTIYVLMAVVLLPPRKGWDWVRGRLGARTS